MGNLSVNVPGFGIMSAHDVGNSNHPGLSIELERQDGSIINLICIQKEDDETLKSTVFAELGTDDYTHCIEFTQPGNAPVEHIDPRWTDRLTRAEIAPKG